MTKFLLALAATAMLALPATDPFNNRCATTLGSNWTAVSGAITDWTVSNTAGGCAALDPGAFTGYAGSDFAAAYWNADSFNAGGDQYSQAVIIKGTSGYQGVGTRFTSGPNGYFVSLESGTCKIYKWVSGVRSDITSSGSCSVSWTDGHTLYLESTGANPTSIVVKDNGSVIGTASDSDIDSGGAPGIIGYADGGTTRDTSWQGSNTGGGGATLPAAIINAPIKCCKGIR